MWRDRREGGRKGRVSALLSSHKLDPGNAGEELDEGKGMLGGDLREGGREGGREGEVGQKSHFPPWCGSREIWVSK